MKEHVLCREQLLSCPPDDVFEFFSRAQNLQRITPPFLHFQVVGMPDRIDAGSQLDYKLRMFFIPFRWRTRIRSFDRPRGFTDQAEAGPFKAWHHVHEFKAVETGTLMRDVVTYRMPYGPIGAIVHPFIRRTLDRIFDFRAEAMADHFVAAPDA